MAKVAPGANVARPEGLSRCRGVAAAVGAASIAMCVAQAANLSGRILLHNASPSEPEGLYVRSFAPPAVGRLVTFMAPRAASAYVDRHLTYLRHTPILKALAAGPGSFVCTANRRLVIDGRILAPVAATDRHGGALPHWNGCRRLRGREWFAYSDRIPNSFDSRYYGPIRADQIIAVYRPLWVGSETVR
jgi:conjugative transfer signal peptidase TraF